MQAPQKVFVACDHAGVSFKKNLIEALAKELPEISFEDLGCDSENSVDYPDYAQKVGREVVNQKARGILICGSGLGMCIAANKIDGVRAASAWDATSARLARQHNNANVLCLGARLTGFEVAHEASRVWLTTAFLGGRHERRVDGITQLEKGRTP